MTLKLISPIAVILAIAAAFYVLFPAPTALPTFSGQTGSSISAETALAKVIVHSNDDHEVYAPGTIGNKIVKAIEQKWPKGPDWKNTKCFTIWLIKEGQKSVFRTIYWTYTGETDLGSVGNLAWYDNVAGKWGGAYPDKLATTTNKLPQSLKESGNDFKIETGCNDRGNPPSLATH